MKRPFLSGYTNANESFASLFLAAGATSFTYKEKYEVTFLKLYSVKSIMNMKKKIPLLFTRITYINRTTNRSKGISAVYWRKAYRFVR
jgi:hypothetical protein